MWANLLTLFGLVVTLIGLAYPAGERRRQHAFTLGSLALLSASLLEGIAYFVALESLVLLGCVLGYLAWSPTTKRVVMLFAAVVAVWFGPRSWSWLDGAGGVGLFAIALGFATQAPLWYTVGSVLVAIRAAVEFSASPGMLPAAFGMLNLTFAAISAMQLRIRR